MHRNNYLESAARVLRPVAPLLILTILLIGLPMFGAVSTGHPIWMYLEFPPHTRYVQHVPFSWYGFTLIGICGLFISGILAFLYLPCRSVAVSNETRRDFPWWGWLAGLCMLCFWTLAWTRFEWFKPFQSFTFTPLWVSYVVLVNALTYRRTGHCLLTHKPRYLLALFPASSLFWWYFEYLNRFAQNWYYIGAELFSPAVYVLHGTIAFSTVLPAVMSTTELLQSYPAFKQIRFQRPLHFRNCRIRIGAVANLMVASFGLICIAIWPEYSYPMVWLSPLVILVAVQVLLREGSVLQKLERGEWNAVILPALAALVCGFFWEMWNYYSYPKWAYSVPSVQRFQIFEMPLLGYFGYLPFGLQCGVVADYVARLTSHYELKRFVHKPSEMSFSLF
jgi:hypothetical protein